MREKENEQKKYREVQKEGRRETEVRTGIKHKEYKSKFCFPATNGHV